MTFFVVVKFRYFKLRCIGHFSFSSAPQDIPRADEVKVLVKDIWDLRIAKLRSSMNEFIKSDSLHAKVNNLTLLEINTVRNLLTKSLKEVYRMKQFAQGAEE
jgi:GINS complex subunit 2